MSLNAFKPGDKITDALLNDLQSSQNKVVVREGEVIDSKTGSGVVENAVAEYNFAIRVTATGVTEISRVEFEIAADGESQDLTVEVRDNDFNPDGSSIGTLLHTIVVPKEFLPPNAAYWSVFLDVAGITSGQNVWVIVKKVGDATDHFHLIGENSQDAAHPCYRRSGDSGAWTANNAIHFRAYSGETGRIIHSRYGDNGYKTIERSGGRISKIYRYLPPADGVAGGIRNTYTITRSSNRFKRGVVS
jgi:hypothetical protein